MPTPSRTSSLLVAIPALACGHAVHAAQADIDNVFFGISQSSLDDNPAGPPLGAPFDYGFFVSVNGSNIQSVVGEVLAGGGGVLETVPLNQDGGEFGIDIFESDATDFANRFSGRDLRLTFTSADDQTVTTFSSTIPTVGGFPASPDITSHTGTFNFVAPFTDTFTWVPPAGIDFQSTSLFGGTSTSPDQTDLFEDIALAPSVPTSFSVLTDPAGSPVGPLPGNDIDGTYYLFEVSAGSLLNANDGVGDFGAGETAATSGGDAFTLYQITESFSEVYFDIPPVPEPSSLFALAGAACFLVQRRRR